MRVVERAVKQIPLPVDLQDDVEGLKDQEALLLAQGLERPNRIQYLWLYGEGDQPLGMPEELLTTRCTLIEEVHGKWCLAYSHCSSA
jgi:hypothetical protein